MGEVSIGSAVDKLEADTQRTRNEGLEGESPQVKRRHLRRILLQSRGSSRLTSLGDEGFHKIFESLFGIVKAQKQVYVRTKNATRNPATSRLSVAAAALRLAVEIGATKIKHKTAFAVLDHIVEVLPTHDEGLCLPLQNDYLKTFRALLEVPSFGEHFRSKQWQVLTDFLLDCLSQELDLDQIDGDDGLRRDSTSDSRAGQHLSVRMTQTSASRSSRGGESNLIDEIIVCIKLLTAITNAPVLSRANEIVRLLTRYLQIATKSQEPVLESLNQVILVLRTEDIQLAKEALSGLIPLIRRMWYMKSFPLREQLLATLSLSQPFFFKDQNSSLTFDKDQLDALLSTLTHEYQRRNERDVLQLEDLAFRSDPAALLHLMTFTPVMPSARAIASWVNIQIIGSLTLSLGRDRLEGESESLRETGPRKRTKLTSHIDEVVERAFSSVLAERLLAIQVLTFLVHRSTTIVEKIANSISRVTDLLLESDVPTVSWSYLLLSELTLCPLAFHFLKDAWDRIRTLLSKHISTSATCRPASHFLSCLVRSGLAQSRNFMEEVYSILFADGAIGPSSLSDASIELWAAILKYGSFPNAKAFVAFGRKSVTWLNMQWMLPTIVDRFHNAQIAFYAKSDAIFSLLMTVLSIKWEWTSAGVEAITSPLFRHLSAATESSGFHDYLLGFEEKSCDASTNSNCNPTRTNIDESTLLSNKTMISEMLYNKLQSFHEAWTAVISERSSNASDDLVEIISSLCAVSTSIAIQDNQIPFEQRQKLMKQVEQIWNGICNFIAKQEKRDRRGFLIVAASTILRLRSSSVKERISFARARVILVQPLGSLMQADLNSSQPNSQVEFDTMDSTDSFITEPSQVRSENEEGNSIRQCLPYIYDSEALYFHLLTDLVLDLSAAQQHDSVFLELTDDLVTFVVSLKPSNLIASRLVLTNFFISRPTLQRDEAYHLLEKIAQSCLQEDNFERCEASLCLCVDILSSLARLWTSANDDLAAAALDIYAWFLKLMDRGVASTRVLSRIAVLLETVMQSDPNFGSAFSLRSPRTSLLQMFGSSGNGVKFMVAPKISSIFDRFVLSEHNAIFDDVVESLPTDPQSLEGMAVRIYLLEVLASRWHTVLRLGLYRIFETAANVPRSSRYARQSLGRLSRILKLTGKRELLNLFAPQLLYTWLETQNIDSMPFQIFDYPTLEDMVRDLQEELVGQAAMRANAKHSERVSELLTQSWSDLLSSSFEKVEGYSIAKDISIPRDDGQTKSAESFVRKVLGADSYLRMIRRNFPDILAVLFKTLGDDQGVEKSFERYPSFAHAKPIYTSICSRGKSTMTSPPTEQQPSFRAKYLVDELDFLCKRINVDSSIAFSPANLIYVVRALLDSAVPALGPLHSRSVLSKLRILVCLAGKQALSGYPLEMLLRNLRPFLTQFYCSEDAIGLFWYLIEESSPYLRSHLSFLSGISVSAFAELAQFTKSEQDSTTQSSQFRSTMSKVGIFHEWLKAFLSKHIWNAGSDIPESRFYRLIELSSSARGRGSSIQGTREGDLVLNLVTDQTMDDPLLSQNDFNNAMEIICMDFDLPSPSEKDILDDEAVAAQSFPVLIRLLRHLKSARNFRKWILRVIGQVYSLKGPVCMRQIANEHAIGTTSITTSYASIVNSLIASIHSHQPSNASMAERTLQMISSTLHGSDRLEAFGDTVDHSLLNDLAFTEFACPKLKMQIKSLDPSALKVWNPGLFQSLDQWTSNLCLSICAEAPNDAVLASLDSVLDTVSGLSAEILPSIIHIALHLEFTTQRRIHQWLSETFTAVLQDPNEAAINHIQAIITVLLSLLQVPVPGESNIADRRKWLEVDYGLAASGALRCDMPTAALFLLELEASHVALQQGRSTRRPSVTSSNSFNKIMPLITQRLDEPDFFYGYQEPPSIFAIAKKLAHEADHYKNVSFQSALFDSRIKARTENDSHPLGTSMASALNAANLQGVARAVETWTGSNNANSFEPNDGGYSLNLHEWAIYPTNDQSNGNRAVAEMFQGLKSASDAGSVTSVIEKAFADIADSVTAIDKGGLYEILDAVAVISDARILLCSHSLDDAYEIFSRREWGANDSFEQISDVLQAREFLFAMLKSNESLRNLRGVGLIDAQLLEARMLLSSLQIAREYQEPQFCLNRATHLCQLAQIAPTSQLKFDAVAQHALAKTLWDQGEVSTPIQMLRLLSSRTDLPDQDVSVSLVEILADLSYKISEARLEKPDDIIRNYLFPAIKALNGKAEGTEAGRIFHSFATFCDRQLQNPDDLDEFARIENLRNRKEQEVLDLEKMVQKESGKQRDQMKAQYSKAKTWFKLDDEEYKRLRANREGFIQQALKNYLLALRACDAYTNDVLRFLALWLDQCDSPAANTTVEKYLPSVPSGKFAPLMNQLSSRVLDRDDNFQRLLFDLLFRICSDHPFHSLYQLFATSKSKGARGDEVATSRFTAATKIAEHVLKKGPNGALWVAVHNSSIAFVRLANERLSEKKVKAGSKVPLRDIGSGVKLEQTIDEAHTKIPPPTMKIELRADRDYSGIPTLVRFDSHFSVASGVSAPKIVTALASDGSRHKMLLKGGNDDLRQDSIMEQVFEQVSNLLKDHRETRQRKLGIRTYKVIPLTPNAGIIEFVKDTIPLHEYLLPAHQRYFPKDFKHTRCRKEISDAQSKPLAQRIQAYRNVCDHFHPVMRFFFMEHFPDPDKWFQKRLAYSRSTAAISILGHVLGLGDRHGHNILLDEQTGEVVHIDLGVAFEAGRVLPVPEVVPFRLTRDLVDGMGLTGVEGVFRRCCNFTLEALRHDQYSIMTILDVLRYDPLYSWSISPLRLAKMQLDQEAAAAAAAAPTDTNTDTNVTEGKAPVAEIPSKASAVSVVSGILGRKKNINEPSEADRALTVVAKKLGKSLSVDATVNELIQQATDEKNLACLYCGWAAYA